MRGDRDDDTGARVLSLVAFAVVGIVLGVGLAWWVESTLAQWAVGLGVAVVVALVEAIADRRRVGATLSGATDLLMLAVVPLALVLGWVPVGVGATTLTGYAFGFGANRAVFGLLYPVPDGRRARGGQEA
jgi:hypothetical protein